MSKSPPEHFVFDFQFSAIGKENPANTDKIPFVGIPTADNR